MILKLKWKYAQGEFDTKNVELVDLPAREVKNQVDAEIAIKDGWNFVIAEIDLGNRESSNAYSITLHPPTRWLLQTIVIQHLLHLRQQ